MAEREYRRTPDWPSIIEPLTGNELAEIWQDGEQRQGPLSVLGGVPSAHAASHKFGGTDVVGTQDKTANAIPITDGDGTLDTFVSDASTTIKGKVQLASNNESAANKAVQGNDSRLSNSRTPTAHAASHLGGSDTLGLGTAAFEDVGVANGICPLNASGQVDSGYLPSYVIEVANYAALPATGESGKIYVTLDTDLTYRWSGTVYVEISKSLALGETSSTAYRGDRGKTAYDHTQATGNPHGTAITDIATLAGKITPLSDLSRVMRINGDGVPMIPDNVAGTYQKYVGFTSSPVYVSGATAIVENGALKLTVTTTGNWFAIFPDVTEYNSALLQIEYRATPARPMSLVSGGIAWTPIASQQTTGSRQVLTGYTSVQNRHLEINNEGWSVGDVVYVYSEYLGSGLYDTPVYGKDGQTVAVNHGAVPVNGKRGKGLLFQGAQYLESPDKLGTSGVIAFKYKKTLNGIYETVISNLNASDKSGVGLQIDADQVLRFIYGDGSLENSVITNTGIIAGEDHDFVVNYTATTVGPVYRDGVQVLAQTNLPSTIKAPTSSITRIGCPLWSTGDQLLNGRLDDILVRSTPMTQDDVTRYHNGDDAVDSQQKAITPVPHSMMTRKSDGRTEVANATEALDAINKSQLDAACSDFLMQSYTAGSTFTAGQLGYLHTDGKVYLFDANTEASAKGALYISIGAVTANNVGTFQRVGEFTTTGLSVGATYYGSETAGAITTTPPTTSGAIVRKIGFAQSSTVLFFNPSNDYVVLV